MVYSLTKIKKNLGTLIIIYYIISFLHLNLIINHFTPQTLYLIPEYKVYE